MQNVDLEHCYIRPLVTDFGGRPTANLSLATV